jgi:hypothetical protein
VKRVNRALASVAVIGVVASLTTVSVASQNGPFEWLNTTISGFNAKPQSGSFVSCFTETFGGIRNDCGSNVTVTLPTQITFPANGFTTSNYLQFYPAKSSAYSCDAFWVINSNASTTNTGTGITFWSSGWSTSNKVSVSAPIIPGDGYLACQMPAGEALDNVYVTGSNSP